MYKYVHQLYMYLENSYCLQINLAMDKIYL